MNVIQETLDQIFNSFENPDIVVEKRFAGNALMARLAENLIVKAELATSGTHDRFDTVKLSVINKQDGVVDSLNIYFRDEFDGCSSGEPYIGRYNNKLQWFNGKLSVLEIGSFAIMIENYLEMFADMDFIHGQGQTLEMQFR